MVYNYRSRSFLSTRNPTLRQTTVFLRSQFDSILLFVVSATLGDKVNIIMSMKLYVGNLSFNTSVEDLEKTFGEIGTVDSANLIEDRETGRSRGFAFVEMSSKESGQEAITKLNGMELNGREMLVNEAKPRENRAGSGGGGRGGYGGGGGRY